MSPTATTTPTPQHWPPVGWITKQTAAERLNLSKDRIAGLVRENKLHSRQERDPAINQNVTLLHEGDVERFIHMRANPVKSVGLVADTPAKPKLERVAQKLLPAPEPEKQDIPSQLGIGATPRPWLTLDEAAEYSGLTKRWLLDLAEARVASPIALRDMGKHSQGGRWRFHRESLDRA